MVLEPILTSLATAWEITAFVWKSNVEQFSWNGCAEKKNELYTNASLLTCTILLEKFEDVTCSYKS